MSGEETIGKPSSEHLLNWAVPQLQMEKIDKIATFLTEFSQANPRAVARFRTQQALDFLLKSNQSEGLGTTEVVGTLKAVMDAASSTSKADAETRGYFAGMQWLAKQEQQTQMKSLKFWMVTQVHSYVYAEVDPEVAGSLRTETVFAVQTPQTRVHYFPGPEHLKPKLETLLRNYQACLLGQPQLNTPEGILFVVKLSCFLFFSLVNLHPFLDGNGRTCRLLANWVLGAVFPFPVPIWQEKATLNAPVDGLASYYAYCAAIQSDRDEEHPMHLTIMTIDRAYDQCVELSQYLTKVGRSQQIGTVTLPMGQIDAAQLLEEYLHLSHDKRVDKQDQEGELRKIQENLPNKVGFHHEVVLTPLTRCFTARRDAEEDAQQKAQDEQNARDAQNEQNEMQRKRKELTFRFGQ